MMPDAKEETIAMIEENLSKITSVTDILKEGKTPEDLTQMVMGDLEVEFTDKIETKYECNCSRERVMRVLATLNKKDLAELIAEGEDIEVNCDFCNSQYVFKTDELKEALGWEE